MKMAIRPDNKPLIIGSVQSVEIEEVHDEVIMVCLKRNGKIYRGALLNSPLGECPVGLPSTPALCEKLNQEFPMPNDEPVVVIEPTANEKNDLAEKVQHSALSYRQSYFQGMPLPPPKALLHSAKDEVSRLKGATSTAGPNRSRHIRLRPRQHLCSRCQSKCGQSTSVSHKSKHRDKNSTKNMKNNIADKSKTLIKKRKLVGDSNGVPRKKIKKGTNGDAKLQIQQQRSPIIKISYATPQGKGHVMRIDPRSQTTNKTSSSVLKPSTQNGRGKPTLKLKGQKNIKTAQKVLKNAKTKAQQKVAARSKTKMKVALFNGFHSPKNNKTSGDGHPKKIRIIKSKGTYHSTTSQEISGSGLTININNNSTKNELNKKTLGTVTVVAAKLPVSPLSNGHNSNDKKQDKNNKKTNDVKSNNKEGVHPVRINGLILPPHIPVKNSGYESSSEYSNQSSKSSRSTKSKQRSASQSSGEGSDCQLVIVESNSAPPQDDSIRKVPPLNLRIHKKNVTKSYPLPDGRVMCIGDIVWGKIIGFPWWPGRINEISVTRRDNGIVLEQEAQITWFAATTLSYMPLTKLYPFLQFFNSRYDRKKRGVYRDAVRQASEAASSLTSEVRALNTMFETSQLQP